MKLITYDIPLGLDPVGFGKDRKGGFPGLLEG